MAMVVVPVSWALLLAIAGLYFRSKGHGSDPDLASMLSLLVPGLGHAYLGAWSHLAVVFIFVLTAGILIASALDVRLRDAYGILILVWVAMQVAARHAAQIKQRRLQLAHRTPEEQDS